MRSHKLTFAALAVMVLATGFPQPVWSDPPDRAPQVTHLTDAHREFLSRVARRTVRDVVLGRSDYRPGYAPTVLETLTAEVVVRLRLKGYLLAQAAGGPAPVALATRDAALGLTRALTVDETIDLDFANELLIEIELLEPAESIPSVADWTQPGALDSAIEPGIHGLVLSGSRFQYRFCPTEVTTAGRRLEDALREVAKSTQTSPSEMASVDLMRFRSDHWYEAAANEGIVRLHRGLSVIISERLTRQDLDRSIAALADYMVYRQLESGLFSYQYEPSLDLYSADDSPVRQAGAAVALAVHARCLGDGASRAGADRSIQYHLKGLTELKGVDGAAFIATADQRNKLGATALILLALGEHPDPDSHAAVREKLARGILWLQRPSGMFLTAFPPALDVAAQNFFPGEALLALAVQYRHRPSGSILDAFDRAAKFYREYFREGPSLAFVPWQVQAFAAMAKQTRRADYRSFVFELTDWLIKRQVGPTNSEWPESFGGIAVDASGRSNFTTAAHLEALCEALSLARVAGDADRVRRYEQAASAAARFIIQLQIRPEEAYFVRSPRDAVGGIRADLSLDLLRIDHCHHALIGLVKARETLFPDRG